MATSKIKGGYVHREVTFGQDVASGATFAEITVPEDGLYLLMYSSTSADNAWLNGKGYAQGGAKGFVQILTRYCSQGETVFQKNLTGAAHYYEGQFQIVKLM